MQGTFMPTFAYVIHDRSSSQITGCGQMPVVPAFNQRPRRTAQIGTKAICLKSPFLTAPIL